MSAARPILFLSDYGLADEFVGVCHAVMASIAPDSTVIDLTHSVPPQDIVAGAIAISRAFPFLPQEAVIVAVVDPGVGTLRRSVAVETATSNRVMVGPDNGLLSLGWAEDGGVGRAVEIASPEVLLEPVSATFHGRDIFAPAAAHLASGLAFDELGPAIDPQSLVSLTIPEPVVREERIDCEVLGFDRFGNVHLSARASDLEAARLKDVPAVSLGAREEATSLRRASTFGDVAEGEFALIVDSAGWLAVVLNRGNAAEALGLARGDLVTLRRGEAVA